MYNASGWFYIYLCNMLYRIALIICCAMCVGCRPHYDNPHIRIETSVGDIEIELYPTKAPKSVAAFLKNIDAGYYKNTSFYRILNDDNQASDSYKSHLIQGGLWKTNYKLSSTLPTVPHETTQQTGITHTQGTLSFARQAPGTASSEFFICVSDEHGLDYGGKNNPDGQGYAAFGKVVNGMKVVGTIYQAPEEDQEFTPPVNIYDIVRL